MIDWNSIDTVLLDMDGTLLDLAYDNYMWMERIPAAYARAKDVPEEVARDHLYATFKRLEGKLDWYCLDHWSEELELDVVALHREQNGRIGFLPEERGLYKKQTARESIAHMARLNGMKGKDAFSLADEMLTRYGLGEAAKKKNKDMSKGMAQKIQFITTVIHNPKNITEINTYTKMNNK